MTFNTLQKFSSIGRGEGGGEDVGIQWKGGFHMREIGILVRKLELLPVNPLKKNNLGMALNIYLIPREDHTSFFCLLVLLDTFLAQLQAIPLWVKLLTFCWHSVLNTLSEVKISIPVMSLLYVIAPPSSHSWSEYSFWYA